MDTEPLRKLVQKYGKPKRLTEDDYVSLTLEVLTHITDPSPMDIWYGEIAAAFGLSREKLVEIPLSVFLSLAEIYDEEYHSRYEPRKLMSKL